MKIYEFVKTLVFLLSFIIVNISDVMASEATNDANVPVIDVSEQDSEISQKDYNHEEVQRTIDDASIDAKKNEENAKQSLKEAKEIVEKHDISSPVAEMAKKITVIEKSRKEIAKMQLLLANNIKKTNEELDNIAVFLKEIESQYVASDVSIVTLKDLYAKTIINWRILVDNSLRFFSEETFEINPLILKNISRDLPQKVNDPALVSQYYESYDLLQEEYNNIIKLKVDLNNANKNYQSNLLLKSGRIRSNILQLILSIDEDFIKYDNFYIDDLVRELKLIPYRPLAIFYDKTVKYKKTINSGFVGFMAILKQIGLLGLLIVILVISKKALGTVTTIFDELSQFCFKKSITVQGYQRIAQLLSLIAPYFKWLILLLIFFISDSVLKKSFFAELSVLIPYFQYYFFYKIFRIFAHLNLNKFLYRNLEEYVSRGTFKDKIRNTTKLLGVYSLSSVYILHLTQSVVRKAYFYNLMLSLFVIGFVAILFVIAYRWKSELNIISKKRFSEKCFKIIDQLLSNKVRSLLFSLLILGVLITYGIIYKLINILGNYDFFKNLLSQIYRKRLESAAKKVDYTEEMSSDHSYAKDFAGAIDDQEFITIKAHPYEEVKDIINNWQLGKSEERSIAIHSEKGIGKSRFVKRITSDIDKVKLIEVHFDNKITNKEEFLDKISKIFGKDIDDKNLFKFLSSYQKKTIIILDDCHNLFMAKDGGFEVLRTFLNFLVKIDNPNILWITTFGTFSWNYLQNAIKIDKYFRHIFRLSRWSDDNIRDLIINRHNRTGYQLTYDPFIFAVNVNKAEKDFEDLQMKFFQIIWSQSRGNPTIAIFLWLSSVNQMHVKSIKISLPKATKSTNLNSLSDDDLFVYAAIIKHHNLSVREISDILTITKQEVLNIVRIGLERGYLMEYSTQNKRFTMSPEWQLAMNKLLINRNFIYAE